MGGRRRRGALMERRKRGNVKKRGAAARDLLRCKGLHSISSAHSHTRGQLRRRRAAARGGARTFASRKLGWMLSATRNAPQLGQLLFDLRCVVTQPKQKVWPHGVTKGSFMSSTQIGHCASSGASGGGGAMAPAAPALPRAAAGAR